MFSTEQLTTPLILWYTVRDVIGIWVKVSIPILIQKPHFEEFRNSKAYMKLFLKIIVIIAVLFFALVVISNLFRFFLAMDYRTSDTSVQWKVRSIMCSFSGRGFGITNNCSDSCEARRNESVACATNVYLDCRCYEGQCWNGKKCEPTIKR